MDIIQAILVGREWSWSVIGLITILFGLGVRSFILRDIIKGIKIRNRNWYQRVQGYYQERSWIGWIFFGIFTLGSMLLWRFDIFFMRYLNSAVWILVLIGFLMLALLCHLRAYARAIIDTVQENLGSDKDI